jgi:hypothetical protein
VRIRRVQSKLLACVLVSHLPNKRKLLRLERT